MKKFVMLLALVLGFSLTGFCDRVHVRNTTADIIYVRVSFNDGTDCVPDNDIVICINAYEGVTVDEPERPFTVRVYTDCPIPDATTESWRHNPFMGCTDPAIFSETPYIIEWVWAPAEPTPWGIIISL
jgi:hypothetical protein